ncbi:MAG: hypothetical protein AAGF10_05405, partial [Verrucomicrobiota bacterium]
SQSGIEMIYGGISLSQQMMEMTETDQPHNQGKGPAPAILVGIAAVLIAVALFVSVSEVKSLGTGRSSAYLAFLALACIGVQMLVGFPAENETQQNKAEATANMDPAEQSIEQMVAFQTVYKPALYLTLLALAIPMVCSVVLTEPKRREAPAMNASLRPDENDDETPTSPQAAEEKPPGQV